MTRSTNYTNEESEWSGEGKIGERAKIRNEELSLGREYDEKIKEGKVWGIRKKWKEKEEREKGRKEEKEWEAKEKEKGEKEKWRISGE